MRFSDVSVCSLLSLYMCLRRLSLLGWAAKTDFYWLDYCRQGQYFQAVYCVFVIKGRWRGGGGRCSVKARERHWEKNIARVKPVQYLFIFYCGNSMLLSILPYNNNKVFFFMYTSVSCVLIVFYDVLFFTLLHHGLFMWHTTLFTLGHAFWTENSATELT